MIIIIILIIIIITIIIIIIIIILKTIEGTQLPVAVFNDKMKFNKVMLIN